jgi:hypothetical protein
MKIKILIFGLFFLAGLLFSMPVFAYTYTRTPAGYTIQNPVSFDVLFDEAWEGGDGQCQDDDTNWTIEITNDEDIILEYLASSTKTYVFETSLPTGVYRGVVVWCYPSLTRAVILEGDFFTDIFEVVSAPEGTGGNIITLPTNMATSMLAYAGQSFSDLAPLLLIGIGLMLAFWLISNALRLTNILDKTKSKKINSWDFFAKEQKEKFKKDDWL